jgi:GAF domain-containing protein
MSDRLESTLETLDRLPAAGLDEQAALDAIVHAVAEALAVPLCKVLEVSEDRQELTVRAGVGWQPGVVGTARISARSDSQPGYALTQGDLVVFEDLSRTRRFTAADLARRHGVISSACLPVVHARRVIGVFCVHDVSPRQFSAEERHFLRRVAQGVARFLEPLAMA